MRAAPLKLIIFLLLISSVFGEEVMLRDKTGKALMVRLINITEGSVKVLLLSNGKKYDIPLNKLEEESLQRVRLWREKGGHLSSKFKVSYVSGKKDRKDKVESYDDRHLFIEPKISLENDAVKIKATKPVKMHVCILGKPVLDRKKVYIIAKESFDIPSIPHLGSHSIKLREIELKYDDKGYAQYGRKYIGYAIFLLSGDAVIYFKCTPSYLESKLGLKLLESRQGDTLTP